MADVKHVNVTCPRCGDSEVVDVPMDQWNAWTGGELIQRAMPQLTASERERLITGFCDTCWSASFGDD